MTQIYSVHTPFLQDPLVPEQVRIRIFEWLLADMLAPFKGCSLVDLGAGPCVFARKARDAGFDVTAVDARVERKPDDLELGSIKFVQSDIREFPLSDFDVVVSLGLLYHLTLDDQKKLLKEMRSAEIVVLETQIHDPMNVGQSYEERLGELQQAGGYEGVYFKEIENPMASWKNEASFWHTEESLTKLISDSGFRYIKKINPKYMSKYGARQYFVVS